MKRLLPFVAALVAFAPLAASAGYDVAQYQRMENVGFSLLFGGTILIFMLTMASLAVGFIVLWVMMLVDALKREWPEKNTWIAILVISLFAGLHWLSGLLYFFLVKQNNPGKMPPAPKRK